MNQMLVIVTCSAFKDMECNGISVEIISHFKFVIYMYKIAYLCPTSNS